MPRDPNRCPTHPGELLREGVLPATGLGQTAIARRPGVSRQHLYDILTEQKPVSPDVAVRLARLFDGSAGSWVLMQGTHDTRHALRNVDGSGIVSLPAP